MYVQVPGAVVRRYNNQSQSITKKAIFFLFGSGFLPRASLTLYPCPVDTSQKHRLWPRCRLILQLSLRLITTCIKNFIFSPSTLFAYPSIPVRLVDCDLLRFRVFCLQMKCSLLTRNMMEKSHLMIILIWVDFTSPLDMINIGEIFTVASMTCKRFLVRREY